jgi:hypothetical protein
MPCFEGNTHRKALAAAMKALENEPRILRAAWGGRVARNFFITLRTHEAQCPLCNAAVKTPKPEPRRIEVEKPDTSVVDEMVAAYLRQMWESSGISLPRIDRSDEENSAPGAPALCGAA